MSMEVKIDSIDLLTKMIVDCRSTVDIDIDVALSIETSETGEVNLTGRKNESNKSPTCLTRGKGELVSENESEIERNLCVLGADGSEDVELLLIRKIDLATEKVSLYLETSRPKRCRAWRIAAQLEFHSIG